MGNASVQRHTRKKRRQQKALNKWMAGQVGGRPAPKHTSKSGRTGQVDGKQLLGTFGKGKVGKKLRADAAYSLGIMQQDEKWKRKQWLQQ